MTRCIPLVVLLLALPGCSLVHDDLPNEPPTVEVSRTICQAPGKTSPDTLISGSDEICQVRRRGEVYFEIRGTDEDDDPLVYHWNAFSAGSFRDTLASAENTWFAPENILGKRERFPIQVTVVDRNCSAVPDPDDHQRCIDSAEGFVENFLIEVVQLPPTMSAIADTIIGFHEPLITIEAFGTDPDEDPLEYRWEQVAGENTLQISEQSILEPETNQQIGSRSSFIAFFPDNYRLRVSVSDGVETVEREIGVDIQVESPPPESEMVRLTLPDTGQEYEIDTYEYPNTRGELPQEATFLGAASLCAAQGKRLCSPAEWQAACQGEELTFSSTDDPQTYEGLDHFGIRFCNTPGSVFAHSTNEVREKNSPSGSFPNCGSTTGVFDLTGNMNEWVAALNDSSALEVFVMRSNVIFEGTCTFFRLSGTLPIEGQDIYDPAVLQQQIENLDEILANNFHEELVGFRCCR